jgi:uncharacterized protein (TIGR03437 family)
MHAGVVPANDQGRVDASLQLSYVTVALQPSAAQQADLEALLQRQKDPSSPDFHRWLTPEQYADRFGLAQADIDKITAWLQTQNLTVLSVARGRNAISFSGPVRSVESAFGTEIHHYLVNGELHYANASEPTIPATLGGVVLAIRGLNDFRLKPAVRKRSVVASPTYTNPNVCSPTNYCMAPDDFATIYDVAPLFSSGINGAGQKLVIVGQTEINPTDLSSFRSFFNLPANPPTMMVVPNDNPVPAVSAPDLIESELDLEWSGAIARNANIIFVYSNDVEDSVTYAIQNNLAPVISMSYGSCEPSTGSSSALSMQALAQQANAQGQTWLAAAGDSGGADCVGETGVPESIIDSAAVDLPGSIPEVTSVGGTEFNESSEPGVTFWSNTNTANNASALRYIPEMVWNDSAADGTPSAGGGGASIFFSKPTWQTGPGVPADGWRDVPDIALPASDAHDATVIFTSNYNSHTGFSGAGLTTVGGTSVAAPSMAGIVTLLNQYLVQNGYQSQAGLGNINPRLYALAQSSPGSFHDITVGSNVVDPCTIRSRNCTVTAIGFNAGPGYDLASGLGSVDVNSLVLAWPQTGTPSKSSTTLTLTSSQTSLAANGSTTLTATVTPANSGTPTGTVTFSLAGGASLGSVSVSNGVARMTVNASQLVTGSNTISAQYSGDSNYTGSMGTATITVSTISKTSTTLTLTSSQTSLAANGSTTLTATVTAANGGTPTGTVTFLAGGTSLGSASVSSGVATLTVSASKLATGPNTISAQYSGDSNYNGSMGTATITVVPSISISGMTNAASFKQVFAPGMIMAVFGSNMGPATAVLAPSVPLPTTLGGVTATINGVAAPLYYVSAGQLNIQIPYATAVNASATLVVTYNGQSASVSFQVAAAAPGIFYDTTTGDLVVTVYPNGVAASAESAAPGTTISLYITGDGAQSPPPTTGSTPAPNVIPKPVQPFLMTVGGTQITPVFIGIPSWSIGVTQVNFQVPASAIPGTFLQVVVTVGNVASAPVNLNIIN